MAPALPFHVRGRMAPTLGPCAPPPYLFSLAGAIGPCPFSFENLAGAEGSWPLLSFLKGQQGPPKALAPPFEDSAGAKGPCPSYCFTAKPAPALL